MRRIVVALAVLMLWATPSFAQVVERVVDGDTIVVKGVGKVRMIGVDTPETVDPRRPVQSFGKEASAFTRRLVGGKVVRVEYDWQRKDKYDRTLAYIYLPDGTFVNAAIILEGYGHAYTKYPFRYLEQFRGYEREAREARRGLWGDSAGVAPQVVAPSADASQTVYVTRTGTKYHLGGCRSLARSRIPISLGEATARFAPCSLCKPPTLAGTRPRAPAIAPPAEAWAPVTRSWRVSRRRAHKVAKARSQGVSSLVARALNATDCERASGTRLTRSCVRTLVPHGWAL